MMTTIEQAISQVAKRMLTTKWYDCENNCYTSMTMDRHDTLLEAIEDYIGLGGGFSLHGVDPYWFCDYRPGIKIELWKGEDPFEEVMVPRRQLISVCERIWNEHKMKQLTLF